MSFIFLIYGGPEWTLHDAVTRAAALMISAIVAFAVHNLIWPVDPLQQLRVTMAAALGHCANAVRALTQSQAAEKYSDIGDQTNALEDARRASATMLQDAQYMLGRQRPETESYLDLVRALEGVLAELQSLDAVIRRYPSNMLIKRYFQLADLACNELAYGFEAPGQLLRGTPSELRIPDPADFDAQFAGIVQRTAGEHRGHDAEQLRELDVVRNTLKDVTRSLSAVQGDVAAIVSPP
jgi:hypothetical protein